MPFTSNPVLTGSVPAWLSAATVTLAASATVGQVMTFNVPDTRNVVKISFQKYRVADFADVDIDDSGTYGEAIGSAIDYTVGSGDPAPQHLFVDADEDFDVYAILTPTPSFGSLNAILSQASGPVGPSVTGVVWGTFNPAHITATPYDWDGTNNVRLATMTVTTSLPAAGTGLEWGHLRSLSPTPDLSFFKTFAETGGALASWTPGNSAVWNSTGGGAAGTTTYIHIGKKDTASGEIRIFTDHDGATADDYAGLRFLNTAPTSSSGSYSAFDTYDVTVSTWTQALAAFDARKATGITGDYVIGLQNANYGAASLGGRTAATGQKIYFQSVNKNTTDTRLGGSHVGGAKFTSIDMTSATGVGFRFVDVDRTGLGYIGNIVTMDAGLRCTFEYSRIMTKPKPATGWSYDQYGGVLGGPHCNKGVSLNAVNGVLPTDCAVRFCHFYGFCEDSIYLNAVLRCTIEQNVLEQTHADNIKIGGGTTINLIDNWLARDWHHSYNPSNLADPWSHADGLQVNSGAFPINGLTLRGNVMMLRSVNDAALQLPCQPWFSSGTFTAINWVFEENIAITDTINGIQIVGQNGSGNIVQRNTLLRCIDYSYPAFNGVYINTVNGASVVNNNVECRPGGAGGWGGANIAINMVSSTANYTAILNYYEGAYKNSTFYGTRPKTGVRTHWSDTSPAGAAEKYRRTLVDNTGFPTIGPAWASWKRQFDPNDEIMGAA